MVVARRLDARPTCQPEESQAAKGLRSSFISRLRARLPGSFASLRMTPGQVSQWPGRSREAAASFGLRYSLLTSARVGTDDKRDGAKQKQHDSPRRKKS